MISEIKKKQPKTKTNKKESEDKIMMILNEICTDEKYMSYGFTKEEVPLIREHDLLFNKWRLEGLTEAEDERIDYLVKVLGL